MDQTRRQPQRGSLSLSYKLKQLELDAYCAVISAFRAQGELTWKKELLLHELRQILKVSDERHKMELLRVSADPTLAQIAQHNPSSLHSLLPPNPSSTNSSPSPFSASSTSNSHPHSQPSSDDSSDSEHDSSQPNSKKRKTPIPQDSWTAKAHQLTSEGVPVGSQPPTPGKLKSIPFTSAVISSPSQSKSQQKSPPSKKVKPKNGPIPKGKGRRKSGVGTGSATGPTTGPTTPTTGAPPTGSVGNKGLPKKENANSSLPTSLSTSSSSTLSTGSGTAIRKTNSHESDGEGMKIGDDDHSQSPEWTVEMLKAEREHVLAELAQLEALESDDDADDGPSNKHQQKHRQSRDQDQDDDDQEEPQEDEQEEQEEDDDPVSDSDQLSIIQHSPSDQDDDMESNQND